MIMKKLELQKMENLFGGPYTNTLDQEAPGPDEDGGGCSGANVMGCWVDVYPNHHLGSLVAGLTTAFIPQTAVALAILALQKMDAKFLY